MKSKEAVTHERAGVKTISKQLSRIGYSQLIEKRACKNGRGRAMPAAWRKGTVLEEKASRHNFPPPSKPHSVQSELNAS